MPAKKGRKRRVAAGIVVILALAVLAVTWYFWLSSDGESLPDPTGPRVKASVGPNANLPEIQAGSHRDALQWIKF